MVSSNRLNGLGEAGSVEGLAGVDQGGTGQGDAGVAGLASQGIELGLGNGLADILLGNRALGNALESLDGLLGGLADGRSRSRELDGQETGVGVGQVGSGNGNARGVGGNLGEQGESSRPLDGGLTAQESSQDGNLRLGSRVAGAGEGNHHRVAVGKAGSLLTTEVLGGLVLQSLAALGSRGDVLEELADPLRQVVGGSAIGDHSNVGLGVGDIGIAGNVLLVEVSLVGGRGGQVQGSTKTVVEGDGVGTVEGQSTGIRVGHGGVDVKNPVDVLVELVG